MSDVYYLPCNRTLGSGKGIEILNEISAIIARIPWTEEDVVAAIHDPTHAIWEDCSENHTSLVAVRDIMTNLHTTVVTRIYEMKNKFEIRERVMRALDKVSGNEWLDEVDEFLDKKRRTNNFRTTTANGLTRLKVIHQELARNEQIQKAKDKAERKRIHAEIVEAARVRREAGWKLSEQILARKVALEKEKRTKEEALVGEVERKRTTQDHLNAKNAEAKMWQELCCRLAIEAIGTNVGCHEVLQTKVPWGKDGEMTLEQIATDWKTT